MKVIIAGSRSITDYALIKQGIKDSQFTITEIVSGGAKGVDSLGEKYARENKIPLTVFKANWTVYGKSAGPRRNKNMAEYSEALIAFHEKNSKGTANMIQIARSKGLQVHVVTI